VPSATSRVSVLFALISHSLFLVVLALFSLKKGKLKAAFAWIGKLLFCVFLIPASQCRPQMSIFLTSYGLLCLLIVGDSSLYLLSSLHFYWRSAA
jgi:hypothetical protein